MKTNKLDKIIKEKFENRTFTPSTSAWERLSVQLDEQPKEKKRGLFFYISIAASILLLVSIGFQIFTTDDNKAIPIKEEIVISPLEKEFIKEKIDKVFEEVPVEEVIVKKNEIKPKETSMIPTKVAKRESFTTKKILIEPISNNDKIIAKVDKKEILKNNNKDISEFKQSLQFKEIEKDPNSSIKINADDLLFAVTHTQKEVKAYYAKYQINRDDVLKTIKSELKKSNLKVNPETILAEVERSIDDDDFQNNFLKNLKRKVSDIATAIASRNN